MDQLISIAVLIATLYGGTIVADKIYCSVREAALTKAAHGLPRLSTFSRALTSHHISDAGTLIHEKCGSPYNPDPWNLRSNRRFSNLVFQIFIHAERRSVGGHPMPKIRKIYLVDE